MKTPTIAILMSAFALGCSILVLFEVQDLRDSIAVNRAPRPRIDREVPVESVRSTGGLPRGVEVAESVAMDRETPESRSSLGAVHARLTGSDEGIASPAASEDEGAFRLKVREAIEANEREEAYDQVRALLDQLIADRRIGELTSKQAEKVQESLVAAEDRVPELIDRIRSTMRDQNVPREERRGLFRAEIDSFRSEVVAELESVIPVADARVIVEEAVSPGPGGPGGRGPRG